MTKKISPIDGWTVVHVGTGAAAHAAGIKPVTYLALSIVYELLEFELEYPRGSPIFGTKTPESRGNMAVDVLAGALGYWIASMSSRRR